MWRSCDIVCYLCIITEVVIFVIFITGEASPANFKSMATFLVVLARLLVAPVSVSVSLEPHVVQVKGIIY